jgi:mono/diheme cytochrome c family protein
VISKLSVAIFLCILSPLAVAAQQANSSLTPVQLQGKGLFKQRCAVCHLSVIVGMENGQAIVVSSRMYGPTLTKDQVIGSEDAIRAQIMNGSARMPGYQYGLKPQQITAIIEYLKTVDKKDVKGDINGASNPD